MSGSTPHRRQLCGLHLLPWPLLAAGLAGTATAEEPRKGGTLVYGVIGDPPTIDCHAASSFATMHYVSPHYSLLVKLDPARHHARRRRSGPVLDRVRRQAHLHLQAEAQRQIPRRHAAHFRRRQGELGPHPPAATGRRLGALVRLQPHRGHRRPRSDDGDFPAEDRVARVPRHHGQSVQLHLQRRPPGPGSELPGQGDRRHRAVRVRRARARRPLGRTPFRRIISISRARISMASVRSTRPPQAWSPRCRAARSWRSSARWRRRRSTSSRRRSATASSSPARPIRSWSWSRSTRARRLTTMRACGARFRSPSTAGAARRACRRSPR